MRSLSSVLLFLSILVLGAPPALADARLHVVAAGETLSALAGRYGVTVARLRELNELDSESIRTGQSLRVDAEPVLRYRTVPGDTLGCIVSRYHVPMERVLEDNPGVSARRLEVGVNLRLRGAIDPRAGHSDSPSRSHDVQAGDTLSELAAHFHVNLAALEAANPGVDAAHLSVGTALEIPTGFEVHEVVRGETLARIAAHYDVELAALRALNPDVRPARLRVGEQLMLPGSSDSGRSIGAPNCGFVQGGRRLGQHPGYVLRNPARSYATGQTVARIRRAFTRAYRRGRDPRVRVHDLGLEGGGPIDDHRSHQSGRDVDITYYRRGGCGPAG